MRRKRRRQNVGSIKRERERRRIGGWIWNAGGVPTYQQIQPENQIAPNYWIVDPLYIPDKEQEAIFHVSQTALELIKGKKGTELWKYLFLLSSAKPSYYSFETAKRKGWWVKLSSSMLDEMLGSRYYLPIVEECISLDILERKEGAHFMKDDVFRSTPNLFRIPEQHRTKSVKVLYRKPRVAKKINGWHEKQISKAIGGDANRQWVKDTLFEGVSIDIEGALTNFRNNSDAKTSIDQIACFEESLYRFAVSDFYFKRDFNTGRLYHSGANLSRLARPYILIDGEETAEIDIGCSQPSFATTLYPYDCEERQKYIMLISDNIYATLEELACLEYPSYKDLKGKFYEEVFYCKNGNKWEKPLWNQYLELLPFHAALITKEKSGNYKRFSMLMQTREAELMIGRVVRRLRLAGIKAITVHDSIVVKQRQMLEAQLIMKEELFDFLGFHPRVDCSFIPSTTPLYTSDNLGAA